MNNFKSYIVAVLLLLSAAALIYGIKYAFTFESPKVVAIPTYSPRNNHNANGNTDSELLLPLTNASSDKQYHSKASYNTAANLNRNASGNYTSQQLTQMSNQKVHSSSVSASAGQNAAVSNNASANAQSYDNTASAVSSSSAPYATANTLPALAARTKTSSKTLAAANAAATANQQSASYGAIRRVAPSTDGTYAGQTYTDTEGTTYYWNEDDGWLTTQSTKIVDGKVYQWSGTEWTYVKNQSNPDYPMGDIPWLFFASLLLLYATHHRRNSHQSTSSPA